MRLEDATERSESNVHVETHGRASHKSNIHVETHGRASHKNYVHETHGHASLNIIPKADTTI